MGIVNLLTTDVFALLCGGQHNIYQNVLEEFLKKLSALANLVFFEDGPVVEEKSETWIERQNEKYSKSINVMEQVYGKVPLREIAENSWDIPSITTCLPLIEAMARKYGELIVTVTKECDAELVRYANNDSSVLAVIADDSDFLIFPGSWRYFSLTQINMKTLETYEFDKIALRKCLELDDYQLKIFATLAGNDIMKYDDVKDFHGKKCGHRATEKIPVLANYVKTKLMLTDQLLIDTFANRVFRNSGQATKEKIKNSLAQYSTNFDVPDFSVIDPLLHYCRENFMNFSFEILQQFPKPFTLVYVDLRVKDFPNLYDVTMELFRKQMGILLQHKKALGRIRYQVCTKKTHEESYKKYIEPPQYPRDELPPLLEFFNREKHPEHDELRFKLLKWMIDERRLRDHELSAIPENYFLDILTLVWLTKNGFITTSEADVILVTIKRVELDIMPKNLEAPQVLNERAFHISFLFTKMHQIVNRSLEITGLKPSMGVRKI
jgi:hypothetical protein